MKKIILAILAIAVPEILLYSGCVVMNNGFITGCTIVVAAVMLYYTVRQFRSVGRWHNFDTTDAFWVSAIVGSVISAVYLGVLSGYGWKAIDGFAQRTFALGPVILAVV